MVTITEADAAYRSAIEAPGRELAAAFEAVRELPISLQGDDLTRAVLLRLRTFLITQDLIKVQLDKVYAAPAADFFVETVAFFLRVALKQLAPNLLVASEKNIVRTSGAMRPDITVWRGVEVIAALECKTQLGWNRDGWLSEFETREQRLQAAFPKAKLLLLVMTSSNWPGFGADHRVGSQFFVLLRKIWPREFDEGAMHFVVNRVEEVVHAIVAHAEV